MATPVKRGAEMVRPPKATPELEQARAEDQARRGRLAAVERRSVVRGLIVLGVLALGWSMVRAGLGRVFVQGWWRQW
jgi:hypothetical protein